MTQNAIVIRGRLTGPKNVELDEPVQDLKAEVEVIIRTRKQTVPDAVLDPLEYLRSLPAGNWSREDIDRQISEERETWGEKQ